MSKYYLYLDTNRCIGCHACEVHCAAKHNLPIEVSLGKFIMAGPRFIGEQPKMATMFLPCFHCEEAWCVAACPAGAIQRRQEDGIVKLDSDLCVGCKACITACPWKIPQWNPATQRVLKCDYCVDKIEAGEEPACVTGCTTGALHFGTPEEATLQTERSYAKGLLKQLL
jgi:Fe-S-cluster-containing dehydrogenase component